MRPLSIPSAFTGIYFLKSSLPLPWQSLQTKKVLINLLPVFRCHPHSDTHDGWAIVLLYSSCVYRRAARRVHSLCLHNGIVTASVFSICWGSRRWRRYLRVGSKGSDYEVFRKSLSLVENSASDVTHAKRGTSPETWRRVLRWRLLTTRIFGQSEFFVNIGLSELFLNIGQSESCGRAPCPVLFAIACNQLCTKWFSSKKPHSIFFFFNDGALWMPVTAVNKDRSKFPWVSLSPAKSMIGYV